MSSFATSSSRHSDPELVKIGRSDGRMCSSVALPNV